MATGNSSDVNLEEIDFERVSTRSNYINRGAFGVVYGPFTWNSKVFAFKQIWISRGRSGDELKTKVEDRRDTWTSLKHKNLIEIHKVILRPKALYVVMEYASGGSLRRLLDNSEITYKQKISNWSRQIAEGMLYLHEADVVHRDLKSNNIMLTERFDPSNDHKEITLKITDFDEAREHGHTTTMSFRGTCAYMAPEVIRTERFSKSSDIWSYGLVVWEMLTGKHPYEDIVDGEIMLKAASGELMLHIPESVYKGYKELLRGCLYNDSNRRLSCQNIIQQLLNIEHEVVQCEKAMELATASEAISEAPTKPFDDGNLVENIFETDKKIYPGIWDEHNVVGVQYEKAMELTTASDVIPEAPVKPFDDGNLVENIFVTGMKIYTRNWFGFHVVGGMEVFYNTGESVLHGTAGYGCEDFEFHLDSGERIISVTARAGHMINKLAFTTNHGNTFGPFGGDGGGEQYLCCSCDGAYLAYITGTVYVTDSKTAVRRLRFVWGFHKSSS